MPHNEPIPDAEPIPHEIDHGDKIEEGTDAVLGFILTQVSMKRGLKLLGDKGCEAVQAELEQLHE